MGYVAISTYMLVINETNINGYIVNVFHTAIFYSIFRLKTEKMEAFMTFLCKVMGGLLLVSIPAFFLYLVGFPFVGVDAVYGDDLYSYTNYFLFMIDDRTLWAFSLASVRCSLNQATLEQLQPCCFPRNLVSGKMV